MEKELKETLVKVADYSELEKEKITKVGNVAFGLTFLICAATIVIQLTMSAELMLVAGETVILLVGGLTYIGMMTYNGIWETGSRFKSTTINDLLIAIICAGVFTILLTICYIRLGASMSQTVSVALTFFAVIAVVGFGVLRMLTYFNRKRRYKVMSESEPVLLEEQQTVNVFIADGNTQAMMILNALKNNDIIAYGQDLGDAGFALARYGMGRGIDDRIAIIVASEKADSAKQVIAEMGLI